MSGLDSAPHTCWWEKMEDVSTPSGRPVPRRPTPFGPYQVEEHAGTTPGPAEISEIAHETAAVIVGAGRAARDPEITRRLVALVDELGLATVADLWSDRPARSLPGALWRLYAIREWVRRSPHEVGREYAAGIRFTDVAHAVAGVAEPPGPDEVRRITDDLLTGVYAGDFAIALDRASAFCAVISAGRADLAGDSDGPAAGALTRRGASMLQTSNDLRACAALWRAGNLT